MAASREKILEKRKRLQIQREKDEAKLKALQLKLRKASLKIAKAEKNEEIERKMILGSFVIEKVKIDPAFKSWLETEMKASDLDIELK